MVKKILVLVSSLFSFISYSQEIVGSFPIALKRNQDSFQIINDTTKTVTFFLSDKNKVKSIRTNSEFKIIDSLSTTRPDEKYSEMIGYTENKMVQNILWASTDCKELFVQIFDYNNKSVSNKPFSL